MARLFEHTSRTKPHWCGITIDPHHRRLDECVSRHLQTFGRAIIIDCHSFPSTPLPYELVQDPRPPDICIGTDAFHTPRWLSEILISAFESLGYRVSVDTPFAGTIVPASFFNRSDRVLSVMIEIRRDLYMDEKTGERPVVLADNWSNWLLHTLFDQLCVIE